MAAVNTELDKRALTAEERELVREHRRRQRLKDACQKVTLHQQAEIPELDERGSQR